MRSTWNSLLNRLNLVIPGFQGAKVGWGIARCVLVCFCMLGLSGCVQSEVGIHFDNPYRGELSQRIHLSNQGAGMSKNQQQWLEGLIRQAQQLDGRVQQVNSGQDWVIRIPFNTADNLQERFNQLFSYLNPAAPAPAPQTSPASTPSSGNLTLPAIASHLEIHQNNFLLFLRSHLTYDIDLQSLGVASLGDGFAAPNGLVDLTFHLETPGGARGITRTPDQLAPTQTTPQSLTWQLQPGRNNHLEATFWMLNPLGAGTVIIIALVAFGLYWQQRQAQPPTAPVSANPS